MKTEWIRKDGKWVVRTRPKTEGEIKMHSTLEQVKESVAISKPIVRSRKRHGKVNDKFMKQARSEEVRKQRRDDERKLLGLPPFEEV